MRTTLDLPAPLLEEALRVSRKKTKTAVIITALEDLIRKNRTLGLKKYKGKIDLNVDLDKLRDRRK
jgi:hypothetical protein